VAKIPLGPRRAAPSETNAAPAEGIIAIQTKPPLPAGFPTVFVDLPVNLWEPTLAIQQQKLEKLGRDCADSIVRQIEPKGPRNDRSRPSFWLAGMRTADKTGSSLRS
jgi:hypothetical protein